MAEEKKDEVKKPVEQAAAAPKAEAKAAEPTPAAAAEPAKTGEEKKVEKVERPANCVACNKSIKKRWYYRDGKFYCSKKCWQTAVKKAEAPAAEAKPQ